MRKLAALAAALGMAAPVAAPAAEVVSTQEQAPDVQAQQTQDKQAPVQQTQAPQTRTATRQRPHLDRKPDRVVYLSHGNIIAPRHVWAEGGTSRKPNKRPKDRRRRG